MVSYKRENNEETKKTANVRSHDSTVGDGGIASVNGYFGLGPGCCCGGGSSHSL